MKIKIMTRRIAIIGGGISGITSALKFAKEKNNIVHIFEKRNCILRGPPYCHLHAGGILYPEITLEDAQVLLNDSILFANRFPDCLNYRPTIVAYKVESVYSTNKLLFKCKVNKISYQYNNLRPFGKVENFYAIYNREDIMHYKENGVLPDSDDMGRKFHDTYVEHFCKLLDNIDSIKYPFVSVCEPGIDQEKVEKVLDDELKINKNIQLFLNKEIKLNELDDYDIIVNASGKNIFNENIDDNVVCKVNEIYEFKSSWIIKTPLLLYNFPEIAIIGERDTDNGMIQLTPLIDCKFQVHCMRSDSTIISTFKDGYPKHVELIQEDIEKRTRVAISQINKYFPIFAMSNPYKPCFGVQRIVGNDKSHRTSRVKIKVEFGKKYIDIITLKAGSIVSLMNKI
jgi:hypothetical protein